MKKYYKYIGILLGALYGITFRLLCGAGNDFLIYKYYNLFSITFIWVLPIVISLIPILFLNRKETLSTTDSFIYPVLSVLLFFLIALSTGIEDWLCILLLCFPFIFGAGIVGIFVSLIRKNRSSKKLRSVLLLPFVLGPIESFLPIKTEMYQVESSVIVNAPDHQVWRNLLEVPEIADSEYQNGFFNFIGVPRPIKSELKSIDGEVYRVGHFTDGFKLYETVSQQDSLTFLEFKIHIDKSELRDLPTDRHLLQSDYFKFDQISYRLTQLEDGKTKLALNCDYRIKSNMNGYANFWAESVLSDFEARLLEVLKRKIERQG